MVTLFHYTTISGKDEILQSNVIKISIQKPGNLDAAYGTGVYLTAIEPGRRKEEIAENNFGEAYVVGRVVACGKIDCFFKIVFKSNDPKLKCVSAIGRNIWLYEEDIQLSSDKIEDVIWNYHKNTPPTGFV